MGSTSTWYCFWNPPTEETSATPGTAREPVGEVPVLKRPEIRQRMLPGLVDEDVLEAPADAGRVGAQVRVDACGS